MFRRKEVEQDNKKKVIRHVDIPEQSVSKILYLWDVLRDEEMSGKSCYTNRYALWKAIEEVVPETKKGCWALDMASATVLRVVEFANA